MNAKLTVLAATAVGLLFASESRAQQETTSGSGTMTPPEYQPVTTEQHAGGNRLAAPKRAFELTLDAGYTQGFGSLQSGVGFPSVAGAGVGFDLGLGYRVDPHWGVALTGQYYELDAKCASGTRGVTGGIAASYHFLPFTRIDPWVQLGTGYRLLWETYDGPTPTLLSHGFQFAKLTAGVDFRLSPEVAIAPVVGADINVFFWQHDGGNTTISDPRASTFIFAGVQGRFDMGGTRETPGGTQAAAHR